MNTIITKFYYISEKTEHRKITHKRTKQFNQDINRIIMKQQEPLAPLILKSLIKKCFDICMEKC